METNPIVWETDRVRELNALADERGWNKEHKEYKARLTYINKEASNMRKASSAPQVKKHSWPKIRKWIRGASGSFRDHHAAKVGLLVPLHAGKWVQDVSCNSVAEDERKALRFVNKQAVGGPYLARLVDLDGNGKKWRVDQPQFVGEEEEEDDDDKGSAPAPAEASKKKKKGEDPEEVEGGDPAEEEATGRAGKRGRSGSKAK